MLFQLSDLFLNKYFVFRSSCVALSFGHRFVYNISFSSMLASQKISIDAVEIYWDVSLPVYSGASLVWIFFFSSIASS